MRVVLTRWWCVLTTAALAAEHFVKWMEFAARLLADTTANVKMEKIATNLSSQMEEEVLQINNSQKSILNGCKGTVMLLMKLISAVVTCHLEQIRQHLKLKVWHEQGFQSTFFRCPKLVKANERGGVNRKHCR